MEIPYGKQNIDQTDIDAVLEALQSARITQGPLVDLFEKKISDYVGSQYSIACNSATSGLFIAYKAMGVGPGSMVWTSTNTFVATSNAALLLGADVDFIDIDSRTFNLSTETLRNKLEVAQQNGGLPDVVTVVHFAGLPCDMEEIAELATKYGFKVVEDASHALGATYKNSKIGDCKYSDAAVFSFHPVKMITTGEGGAVTTNNSSVAESCFELRSHGVTRDEKKFRNSEHGPWYFEQHDLGLNLRLTDFQCALGISQLKRLDRFVKERNEAATLYQEAFAELPISTQEVNDDRTSSFHLFTVFIESEGVDRDEVISKLKNSGIQANVHYIPVPYHPYYQDRGFNLKDYPETDKYFRNVLSIPLYAGISKEEVSYVTDSWREVLSEFKFSAQW
jgi:UDP-4-amino-4,6-dideoxy-N-acetyl-beta-L-altrosamine transaminase